MKAIKTGNLDKVKELIKNNNIWIVIDPKTGNTSLHIATLAG